MSPVCSTLGISKDRGIELQGHIALFRFDPLYCWALLTTSSWRFRHGLDSHKRMAMRRLNIGNQEGQAKVHPRLCLHCLSTSRRQQRDANISRATPQFATLNQKQVPFYPFASWRPFPWLVMERLSAISPRSGCVPHAVFLLSFRQDLRSGRKGLLKLPSPKNYCCKTDGYELIGARERPD